MDLLDELRAECLTHMSLPSRYFLSLTSRDHYKRFGAPFHDYLQRDGHFYSVDKGLLGGAPLAINLGTSTPFMMEMISTASLSQFMWMTYRFVEARQCASIQVAESYRYIVLLLARAMRQAGETRTIQSKHFFDTLMEALTVTAFESNDSYRRLAIKIPWSDAPDRCWITTDGLLNTWTKRVVGSDWLLKHYEPLMRYLMTDAGSVRRGIFRSDNVACIDVVLRALGNNPSLVHLVAVDLMHYWPPQCLLYLHHLRTGRRITRHNRLLVACDALWTRTREFGTFFTRSFYRFSHKQCADRVIQSLDAYHMYLWGRAVSQEEARSLFSTMICSFRQADGIIQHYYWTRGRVWETSPENLVIIDTQMTRTGTGGVCNVISVCSDMFRSRRRSVASMPEVTRLAAWFIGCFKDGWPARIDYRDFSFATLDCDPPTVGPILTLAETVTERPFFPDKDAYQECVANLKFPLPWYIQRWIKSHPVYKHWCVADAAAIDMNK